MKLISIITSNPIFIKLQYESFKKYMKTPYDYIVFNDGKNFPDFTNNNTPNKNEITELCKELNIMCIEIENESHRKNKSCSIRHADSLKVVLEYMKENLDEYLIIDGDMFMIDHLDINKYRKYNCACVLQSRSNIYMWPNLLYINLNKIGNINDLNLGIKNGDTGSASSEWLLKEEPNVPTPQTIRYSNQQHTTETFYFIKHLVSNHWKINDLPDNLKHKKELIQFLENDERNKHDHCFAEIYDNIFFHYRASTWYMVKNNKMHTKQIESLMNIVEG